MSAKRQLSERELNEQIRLSAKKEILAFLKDGVPKSPKFDDAIECWKQSTTELQLHQAALNRFQRIVQMLPPKEREREIKKVLTRMLPTGENTI